MASYNEIYDYVYQFRKAIDKALQEEPRGFDRGFLSFPRGMCTVTSDLLGIYLLEKGIKVNSIRSGNWDNNHEWLITEEKGIHIDITGDQFPDYGSKIFVSMEPDEYHISKFSPFIVEEFMPPTPINGEVYDRTMKNLSMIIKHI